MTNKKSDKYRINLDFKPLFFIGFCQIPDTFKNYLYTKDLPEIDLLIRTSGEERLSNFMLYQLAYSEFIFTKTYWPDFKEKELIECLKEFESRDRRFGKITEE